MAEERKKRRKEPRLEADEHETVSSEEEDLADENEDTDLESEEEAKELHSPASSEDEEIEETEETKEAGAEAEAEVGLIEDGNELETHGGGEPEYAPGFAETFALTEGFTSEEIEIDETLEALPRACDLEYEVRESVCGRDDRVRIRSTTRIPWRLCCQLIITMKDGRGSRCTGWFIGPRTVMTAGHCVYSHSAGGWARQIQVIPPWTHRGGRSDPRSVVPSGASGAGPGEGNQHTTMERSSCPTARLATASAGLASPVCRGAR